MAENSNSQQINGDMEITEAKIDQHSQIEENKISEKEEQENVADD